MLKVPNSFSFKLSKIEIKTKTLSGDPFTLSYIHFLYYVTNLLGFCFNPVVFHSNPQYSK